MSTPIFCHLEDLAIIRPGEYQHTGPSDFAKLYDCDGQYLGALPNSWTDEQIRTALRFANNSYAKGYEHGQRQKAADIRAMLGINQTTTE